jgi:hypothetical protein
VVSPEGTSGKADGGAEEKKAEAGGSAEAQMQEDKETVSATTTTTASAATATATTTTTTTATSIANAADNKRSPEGGEKVQPDRNAAEAGVKAHSNSKEAEAKAEVASEASSAAEEAAPVTLPVAEVTPPPAPAPAKSSPERPTLLARAKTSVSEIQPDTSQSSFTFLSLLPATTPRAASRWAPLVSVMVGAGSASTTAVPVLALHVQECHLV